MLTKEEFLKQLFHKNNFDEIPELLKNKPDDVDINTQDANGKTALDNAIEDSNVRKIIWYIRLGADPLKCSPKNYNLLKNIINNSFNDLASLQYIEHYWIYEIGKYLALNDLKEIKNSDQIKIFVEKMEEYHGDINSTSEINDLNAMQIAIDEQNYDLIKLLIYNGADPYIWVMSRDKTLAQRKKEM